MPRPTLLGCTGRDDSDDAILRGLDLWQFAPLPGGTRGLALACDVFVLPLPAG